MSVHSSESRVLGRRVRAEVAVREREPAARAALDTKVTRTKDAGRGAAQLSDGRQRLGRDAAARSDLNLALVQRRAGEPRRDVSAVPGARRASRSSVGTMGVAEEAAPRHRAPRTPAAGG